jgi:RNA polymerase sigma factor (sigma-70 family)
VGLLFEFKPDEQDALLRNAQLDPAGRAMDKLIRRYEPLTQRIARSLTQCPLMRDDLANEARIALTRAVANHDVSRSGFAVYAERYMVGAAKRYLVQWNRRTVDLMPEDIDPEAQGEPELGWGEGDVAFVVGYLKVVHQELLMRRYVLDHSLLQLARSSGTSESAVSQRLRTAEEAVRRLLVA